MQPNFSYNEWLRDTNNKSEQELLKNMVKLQAQLSVVQSVLQEEIGTVASQAHRVTRVNLAMIHLMTEIHLLVTMKEVG